MQSVLVCSLLAAGALSAPTPAPPKKVSLPKRSGFARATGDVDGASYLGHLNYTLQKYSKKSLKSYGSATDILKRQRYV